MINMKIFKLYNQVNGYAPIDFTNDEICDVFDGQKDVSVINGHNYKWSIFESDNKRGDSPFYLGAFPIFEEKKVKGFDFADAKTAVFKVEGVNYVAVGAPIITGDIIDKEESDIELFSNGLIMCVWKYALKSNVLYPPIFRIEEYPYDTFVTESMRASLNTLGLSQLLFEECLMVE